MEGRGITEGVVTIASRHLLPARWRCYVPLRGAKSRVILGYPYCATLNRWPTDYHRRFCTRDGLSYLFDFFYFFFYFISFESFDKWKKNICKNVSQQELYIRIKFQIRNNFQPENSTGCLISISRNSEFGGVKRNKVNSACRPNRYLDQLQSYNETDGGKTRLEGSREEYHFPFFFHRYASLLPPFFSSRPNFLFMFSLIKLTFTPQTCGKLYLAAKTGKRRSFRGGREV